MFQEEGKLHVCVCVCACVRACLCVHMYVSIYVPPIVHLYKRVMKLGGRIMPLEIALFM